MRLLFWELILIEGCNSALCHARSRYTWEMLTSVSWDDHHGEELYWKLDFLILITIIIKTPANKKTNKQWRDFYNFIRETIECLESELLEEPFVLAGLVPVRKMKEKTVTAANPLDTCIIHQDQRLNTHLSSNLTLASLLALRFRAGSLNTSLLTMVLSRGMSTEYLQRVQKSDLSFLIKQMKSKTTHTNSQKFVDTWPKCSHDLKNLLI